MESKSDSGRTAAWGRREDRMVWVVWTRVTVWWGEILILRSTDLCNKNEEKYIR